MKQDCELNQFKAMVETEIEIDSNSNSESNVLYNEDRKLLIFTYLDCIGSYFFLNYFFVLFVTLKHNLKFKT